MLRLIAIVFGTIVVLVGTLTIVPASAFSAVALENEIENSRPDERPVLPQTIDVAPEKKLYVALGDSFSSGEGAPAHVYTKGGIFNLVPHRFRLFLGDPRDDGYACHRSPHAYPVSVATALGPAWGLDFRACSGASFDDLDGIQNGEPPQLDAVASRRADLVTMTMGGNDLEFAEIVKACVAEAAVFSHVGPNDCRTREGDFVSALEQLRPHLRERYGMLHRALAPGGRLVVLGYPRMFPVNPPGRCGAGVGPGGISEANMLWVNTVATRLSQAVRAAAVDVGATYVDITNLFGTDPGTPDDLRHDACIDSDDRRWVNRTILDSSYDPLARKWSWHPKVAAHDAMAELVSSCLRDPMVCDSPERRRAVPATPEPAPAPCLANCPDLTVSDQWTELVSGALTSDSPGMTATLFNALYLRECDLDQGGPGLGTTVEEVATGDLTGDGWNEAVISLECIGPTSSWPEHVVVLDGSTGPRAASQLGVELTDGRLIGTTSRPRTSLHNLQFGFTDGGVVLAGDARSDSVANAGPADYQYRQTFTWRGNRWEVGDVVFSPQQRSDESSGTSQGPLASSCANYVVVGSFADLVVRADGSGNVAWGIRVHDQRAGRWDVETFLDRVPTRSNFHATTDPPVAPQGSLFARKHQIFQISAQFASEDGIILSQSYPNACYVP